MLSRNVDLFLISSIISGLLVQLQIVSNRIARISNRAGAIRSVALDMSKAFVGFSKLVFFTDSSLMEFQVRFLVLFFFISL